MVDELITILIEDILLSSTNSYFTREEIAKEEQLAELPMLIIIEI